MAGVPVLQWTLRDLEIATGQYRHTRISNDLLRWRAASLNFYRLVSVPCSTGQQMTRSPAQAESGFNYLVSHCFSNTSRRPGHPAPHRHKAPPAQEFPVLNSARRDCTSPRRWRRVEWSDQRTGCCVRSRDSVRSSDAWHPNL